MTDWVAYIDEKTKASRSDWLEKLNFGGISDWAVDLGHWYRGTDIYREGGWTVTAEDDIKCDPGSWPDSLERLDTNANSMPARCRYLALMRLITKQLNEAANEYRTVSDDYEDKFWWFSEWVKDAIDTRLDEFLALGKGEGLKYMDCRWSTNENEGEGPCTKAVLRYDLGPHPGPRVIEFKMRDENGFYDALLKKTGIKKEWVRWADDAKVDICMPQIICPGLGPCPEVTMCDNNYFMRKTFPRRILEKEKINIENPKKIVDEAIPRIDKLVNIAIGSYLRMTLGLLDADEADVLTALSMPLLMLQDASKSIREIKEIGEKHKKEKTTELVLMILNIVFSVLPIAGFASGTLAGASRFATAALLIGEAGNSALSIFEAVENPASAPFAVLSILTGIAGGVGTAPRSAFRKAASVRRMIGSKKLEIFSPEFQHKDKLIQNIIKTCRV